MASADTMQKPSYLGLLNAISLAESAAGVYLEAWANVTPNEDLACCLRLVAARERSHGEVFCRRIAELGYTLKPKADPRGAAQLAKLANPNISDLEKVGPEREEEADPFGEIRRRMAEGEFDQMTVNLMNWYIAEEKDSGKRLREAYACVREMAGGRKKSNGASRGMSDGPSADAEAIMACMTAGFAKLEKSLEKLARVK
ncbi:MAG: ferritin family protein [Caulobacterales bacterium]